HRGEGLGLHVAEAMWLGTPVIATSYGGVTDLIDESTAVLIPWGLAPVLNGDGAYPEGEMWAEPNILRAIDAMRDLAASPARRAALAGAASQRIAHQPGEAERGTEMWAAIEARLAARPTEAASRSRALAGARRVARRATAPA